MEIGERLAAYLAGELPEDERAALEADLDRDSMLRAHLDRIRRADQALAGLPPVEPREGFSGRLRAAVAEELAAPGAPHDQLADRRSQARRSAPWRALGAAAAAAAVIAVVGVGAGVLLRGGSDQAGDVTAHGVAPDTDAGPDVVVTTTDNDYDDVELQRLAVGLDPSGVVPPGLGEEQAAPLGRELADELGRSDASSDSEVEATSGEAGAAEGAAPRPATTEPPQDVQRCLPQLLESASSPLIPLYVELARYRGERAIVYAFGAQDPDRGSYRRVEVWAVARSDCQVLSFAQYDRP
ncbi:MAG TPA: hypothetical protein VHF25_06605 [Nitriliruptorales bacterium]|nr:hypothetical protein [Nitriliruptorales bacterium]